MTTIYTVNNKVLKNVATDKWLTKAVPPDPYNPLGLPPFTIRCKFRSGYTPSMGDTQTLVDSSENVWDITKNSTDWSNLFQFNDYIADVLGANTTGVTIMTGAFMSCNFLNSLSLFDTSSCTTMNSTFYGCRSLSTIPLFDTSSCTILMGTFQNCYSLTSVPLFNTSNVTHMEWIFQDCHNVQSGALALYQQASLQATVPGHSDAFANCGRDTVTGAAELAQIPSSWGGTGS